MSTTYLINLVFTLSYIKSGYVHKEIQLTLKYKHIWSEALLSSHRHTLNMPVMWTGVGVHGGLDTQVKAIPYHPNNDQQPGVILCGYHLSSWQVVDTSYSTVLAHPKVGVVKMTEHLFAALFAAGIDDVLIDVDGEECPILDGSASAYINRLKPIKTHRSHLNHHDYIEREWIDLPHSFSVSWKESSIKSQKIDQNHDRPITQLPLTMTLALDLPPLEKQIAKLNTFEDLYDRVIPAQTFGFLKDEHTLRQRGLIKGVNYNNTTIYDDLGQALSPPPIRHAAAHHKLLDTIGDLYRLGKRLKGHLIIHRGGHHINHLFVTSHQSN
jgi:UDP-3-O-[3-hydroxymyristoyl] N-acetylglucosamine deacetylase